MNPLWQVVTIVGFAMLNGVLAMSEIAVVSARKARLRQAADRGEKGFKTALALANEPTQVLAAVQSGITLVGILAGAFGEATLSKSLAAVISKAPLLAPYAMVISTAAVVAFVTYVSLVIGELAPKRLALNSPERVAAAVAPAMRTLSRIAQPLVWLLSRSTDLVVRLLGVDLSGEPDVTPDEIEVLVKQGAELGVFDAAEQDIIASALRLDERRVDAFMTPRTRVAWLDLEDSEEQMRQVVLTSPYSRFPVIKGDPDNAQGILYARDIAARAIAGEPFNPEASLRPVLFVPESMSVLRLLEIFKREGRHIALVTDEYGSVQGMVTDMDLLEAIVGDIPAPNEPETPQVAERDDGSLLVDGLLRIELLWEHLGLDEQVDTAYHGYQTVSGFVMAGLERIPSEGMSFSQHGFRFEIVDMDGRRIDKVLVTRSAELAGSSTAASAGADSDV